MREYKVKIKGKFYLVPADENYKARLQGVKLYMNDYPRRYTFAHLMSEARAHLTHPYVSGRKPIMDLGLF